MTTKTRATVEKVMRVSDVARHLDIETSTVYRLIQAGDLRSIRVGRLIRVPASALAEFISGPADDLDDRLDEVRGRSS